MVNETISTSVPKTHKQDKYTKKKRNDFTHTQNDTKTEYYI